IGDECIPCLREPLPGRVDATRRGLYLSRARVVRARRWNEGASGSVFYFDQIPHAFILKILLQLGKIRPDTPQFPATAFETRGNVGRDVLVVDLPELLL